MDVEGGGEGRGASAVGKKRPRANSVPRDRSSTARDAASRARSRSPSMVGLKDEASLARAEKLAKKKQFKMNKLGYVGESDRRVMCSKPKHLFSGKRGNGKTDRR